MMSRGRPKKIVEDESNDAEDMNSEIEKQNSIDNNDSYTEAEILDSNNNISKEIPKLEKKKLPHLNDNYYITNPEEEIKMLKEELRIKEAEFNQQKFLATAPEKLADLEKTVEENRKYIASLFKQVQNLTEHLQRLLTSK